MTKSLANRIYLKRQLYSLRIKEGSNVPKHLNVFNTLICQLTDMEVKIHEEDKAITLLCSLPESWDHFITSISFRSADSLKFESVVGALLSEEVRRKSSICQLTDMEVKIQEEDKAITLLCSLPESWDHFVT